jgi:two-component SAPR family response regulator
MQPKRFSFFPAPSGGRLPGGVQSTAQTGGPSGVLAGKRILIVEDEFFIAIDLVSTFKSTGACIVGPVPSPDDALLALDQDKIDAAVLDVKLCRGTVLAVADELRKRGIPFVFASAYTQDVLPPRFLDRPHLMKPFRDEDIVDVLARELGPRS